MANVEVMQGVTQVKQERERERERKRVRARKGGRGEKRE